MTTQELEKRLKQLESINSELRRKNILLRHELSKMQCKRKVYSLGIDLSMKAEKVIFEAIKAEYLYFEEWMLATVSRKNEYVVCRQLFQSLMHDFKIASLKNIGMKCGGRDHSTILHACRTVHNLAETDREFKRKYESILNSVEQGLYTPELLGKTTS